MPQPNLNGVGTTDTYTDATTVLFTQPTEVFQLQVSNNAIFYQVAIPGGSGMPYDVIWDSLEYQLVPSLSNFDGNDAAKRGANKMSGIRVRSRDAGNSAIVSVA